VVAFSAIQLSLPLLQGLTVPPLSLDGVRVASLRHAGPGSLTVRAAPRQDGGRTPRAGAAGTVPATPDGPPGSTMGVWGSVADGTVVVTPGAGGGADYGAALRAVAESNGCAGAGAAAEQLAAERVRAGVGARAGAARLSAGRHGAKGRLLCDVEEVQPWCPPVCPGAS